MKPFNRININFQQIFKDDRKGHSDPQNSFTQSSSHPVSLHDQADSILQDSKELSNQLPIQKNASLSSLTKTEVPNPQVFSSNKTNKKKQSITKKIEQGDSSKITAKLYQHKSSVCSKSHNKSTDKDNKQTQTPQKHIKEIVKTSNLKQNSNIYDRLYNMSKSQLLKQLYFHVQPEKQKSQPKKLANVKSAKYLRNYVPLQKRVEQYIAQGQNINNQSMISKKSEKDFHPQLIRNKYTNKVQSKYNKSQIKQLRASQLAQFLNSSVSSSFSTMSRSAQIMQRVEQHFLQKVKLIFVRQDDEVEISQESIGLLTDVQFHILQPFILQMQQSNNLNGINFQQRFRQFYNSLQLNQKMSLRNHQAKIKSKYVQLKQEVKEKKKQTNKIQPKKSKIVKKEQFVKKPINSKSYHLAIQQFI